MSNIRSILFPFLMIVCLSTLFAQVKTNGIAVGAGVGTNIGDMDFGRDDFGLHSNLVFRHGLWGFIEGQITAGIGELERNDANSYRTVSFTGDYRLLLRPIAARSYSLYVYGGYGALNYDVRTPPENRTAGAAASEWTTFAPLGAGVQIKLLDRVSLDVSGGYNLSLSKNLNIITGNDNDNFYGGSIGLIVTGDDGGADPDKDKLVNREEKRYGTNKNNPDTDGDRLSDGVEVYDTKTNPLKPDTDGDRLNDREEIEVTKTNPRNPDTDGDGLQDGEERLTYLTNPLKKDTDGDRLSDKDEILSTKTDPNKADTDGDGLDDGREYTLKTDPLNPDTDSDRLTDRIEVEKYNTDPLNPDTDGGTANDGVEVGRGTNPLDPNDDVILDLPDEPGEPIILVGIIFEFDRATIMPQSELILEKAWRTMEVYPELEVEIHGHTDNVGSESYNEGLSRRRADSVRQYLVNKGIDPSRVATRGFGETNPIDTNDTEAGRTKNRRIEFVPTKLPPKVDTKDVIQ